MINQTRPTNSLTNTSRVSSGETWNSITTIWDEETRIWNETGSLVDNTIMSATNPLWYYRTFPWQLSLPWQITNQGIINQSRP